MLPNFAQTVQLETIEFKRWSDDLDWQRSYYNKICLSCARYHGKFYWACQTLYENLTGF